MRPYLVLSTLCGLAIHATAVACPGTLLVSGYTSDNVHLYDACDGQFLRLLDSSGRMDGTQATAIGQDGLIYVASEENGRILRYASETLEFVDILADTDGATPTAVNLPVERPTGLAIGQDGHVYVAGFDSDDLVRIDPVARTVVGQWSLLDVGLAGPDAGLEVLPDGRLLIPGFDSHNIAVLDPQSGSLQEWVSAGGGVLRNPRVIRHDPDNDRILVTSWGNGQVHAFDSAGGHLGELLRTSTPSGLVIRPNGELLLTSDQFPQVGRFSAEGQFQGLLVSNGSGGLNGSVFLTLQEATATEPPVSLTTGDQFWLIGVGSFDGLSMTAELVTTHGTRFGAAFDPQAVDREVFGSVTFEVIDCANAHLQWSSADPRFDQGGYPLVRVAPNAAQAGCEADGLSTAAAQGTWFGGAERDGEGVMIDVLSPTTAVITWYSYIAQD